MSDDLTRNRNTEGDPKGAPLCHGGTVSVRTLCGIAHNRRQFFAGLAGLAVAPVLAALPLPAETDRQRLERLIAAGGEIIGQTFRFEYGDAEPVDLRYATKPLKIAGCDFIWHGPWELKPEPLVLWRELELLSGQWIDWSDGNSRRADVPECEVHYCNFYGAGIKAAAYEPAMSRYQRHLDQVRLGAYPLHPLRNTLSRSDFKGWAL